MNDPPYNTDEIKCEYCVPMRQTYIAMNEEGTKYQVWYSNPCKGGTWISGKWYRNYLYLKAHPRSSFRRSKLRKGSENQMSNKLVNDSSERRRDYCGADRTYIAGTKNGSPFPKRVSKHDSNKMC